VKHDPYKIVEIRIIYIIINIKSQKKTHCL